VDIGKWLEELDLGQYADFFANEAIDEDVLSTLTYEELREIGVQVGHCKKILAAIEEFKKRKKDHTESSRAFVNIEAFPTILAVPLNEYIEEKHPVLKLWHACDVVDLTLRLIVDIGLAEMQVSNSLSSDVLRTFWDKIEVPTLGRWQDMASTIATHINKEKSVMPEIVSLVQDVLNPFLDGSNNIRSSETSFLVMRNHLAHGGGISRTLATKMLDIWGTKFESLIQEAKWISQLSFVVRLGNDYGILRGTKKQPEPYSVCPSLREKLEKMFIIDEAIAMIRGKKVLSLWPLALYGFPRSLEPEEMLLTSTVTQIYVRRHIQLQYTPIGSEEICQSSGTELALEAFVKLLRLDDAVKDTRDQNFQVKEFEKALFNDASQLVGRSKELAIIRRLLEQISEGVLWLTGTAGIGKSYLIAAIAMELIEKRLESTIVLPYRFKVGDERCNRHTFLNFSIERMKKFIFSDENERYIKKGKQKKAVQQLKEFLEGLGERRAIFILDGLDEITERDKSFAQDVPFNLALPGVLWLCAGRAEKGLSEVFSKERCVHIFEYGVPGMGEGDIRTMLLNKIGPLRKKLLRNDREDENERVINPFIQKVTRCAEGLPIYVTYVIGDILSNKYRVLDASEKLPPSLHHYYEQLLHRYDVGDISQVKTPLVGLLALAQEPLKVDELTFLLQKRGLVLEGKQGINLVRHGLTAISSMIRSVYSTEGEEQFTLNHHSLRQHLLTSQDMNQVIITAGRELHAYYVEFAQSLRQEKDNSLELSLQNARNALQVAQSINDDSRKASAYIEIVHSLRAMKRFSEGLAEVMRAYEIAEGAGDSYNLARALELRAGNEFAENQDFGNFALIERASSLYEKVRDFESVANAHYTRICMALRKEKWHIVEESLKKFEQINLLLKDRYLEAVIYQVGGEFYCLNGKWEEALGYLEKATYSFRKLNNEIGICASQGWIGLTLCHQGRMDEGLDLVHSSLKMEVETLNSLEGSAKWLMFVGQMFIEQKQLERALGALWLARDLHQELGHFMYTKSSSQIKQAKNLMGDKAYLQAEKAFEPRTSEFAEYAFLWGLGKLRKHKKNPILKPKGTGWESRSVFNPTAWTDGKKVYLIYRAEGPGKFSEQKSVSSIGLAISEDGITFQREPDIVIAPEEPYETPGGCEDPRIILIDGIFYLTYTGFDGKVARLCMAVSEDLHKWVKLGPVFSDDDWENYFPKNEYPKVPKGWSKSGAILSEPINGEYYMFFGDTNIWAAVSTDLKQWKIIPDPVLSPRPGLFDSVLVESGPPPVILPEGIYLVYNGANDNMCYGIGQVLLDKNDPTRVIRRCSNALLIPETVEEKEGKVPQVVFGEGLVFFRDNWLLYYGMADSCIGMAFAEGNAPISKEKKLIRNLTF